MAEALGVVASVQSLLTLAQGIGKVIDLWNNAPKEIAATQEQAQLVNSIVQAMDSVQIHADSVLDDTISHVRAAITDLQLITETRDGDGSCWGLTRRHVLGMTNKRQVDRSRARLKASWEALLGAISTDILSATTRIEVGLATVTEQSMDGQSIILGVKETLKTLANDLGAATVDDTVYDSRTAIIYNRTRPCFKDSSKKRTSENSARVARLPRVQRASPASYLELSNSFRPESYTTDDGMPHLFDFEQREVEATAWMWTKRCSLLYSPAPRKWVRLKVLITTSKDSKYWDTERVTSDIQSPKTSNGLLDCLLSALELFLNEQHSLSADACLGMFLGMETKAEEPDRDMNETKPAIKLIASPNNVTCDPSIMTRMVHHWGCPWYLESWLDHRPWPFARSNNQMLAWFGSEWVCENRLSSEQWKFDAALYQIQMLHCLKGTSGIAQFLGVVLGDESRTVIAYLFKLASKGPLSSFIDDVDIFGKPVTWARREKWCKQTVAAVAEVHSKGFVVGTLGHTPYPGADLDDNDDVVLCRRVQTTNFFAAHKTWAVPPEKRALGGAPFLASMEGDIFQLGSVLWRICNKQGSPSERLFCRLAGCKSKGGCNQAHARPIQLPPIETDTPRYLLQMIAACRSEDPAERPTAHELVGMFPVELDTRASPRTPLNYVLGESRHHLEPPGRKGETRGLATSNASAEGHLDCTSGYRLRPEDIADRYGSSTFCDECGRRVGLHQFRCNICAMSDYDLCLSCFEAGIHCMNCDHFLKEKHPDIKENKYYSCVRECGSRDVKIM